MHAISGGGRGRNAQALDLLAALSLLPASAAADRFQARASGYGFPDTNAFEHRFRY